MPPPLQPSKSSQQESGFSRNKLMNSTPICSRTDRKDHCVLDSRNLPLSLIKKIYTALLKYQQFKTLKNLASLRSVRILIHNVSQISFILWFSPLWKRSIVSSNVLFDYTNKSYLFKKFALWSLWLWGWRISISYNKNKDNKNKV